MSIIAGTIITICVQSFSAYYNYSKNKKNAEEIKELQQEYKQKRQQDCLQKDREKFYRSCELQLKMEEEEHNYKIDVIKQKLTSSIQSLSKKYELQDYYPLVLSPQIISNPILPVNTNEIENVREHLLCILSNSNNDLFNKLIIPDLDNYLSTQFAKYWNRNSLHQICYYTNVWKKDRLLSYDDSDWNNLQLFVSSPTIFISPLISSSNRVTIRTTLIVNDKRFHYDKELNIDFDVTDLRNTEKIKNFKLKFKDAYAEILSDAALIVDSHYWINYKIPPRLPRLLSSKIINLDTVKINEYMLSYEFFYRNIVLGEIDDNTTKLIETQSREDIKLLASINQFNHPKRCLSFLESITEAYKLDPRALIIQTLHSIYKAKTDLDFETTSDINVELLDKDDINIINDLVTISKKYNDIDLTRELITIIKNKISKLTTNMKVEDILNVASEKLEILKNSLSDLSIQESLSLARDIRNNINSSDITKACANDVRLSNIHTDLVTKIKVTIEQIIKAVLSDKIEPIDRKEHITVKNFNSAKKELMNVISKEKNSSLFKQCYENILHNNDDFKTHIETLDRVYNTCKNGTFKVLLVGEYQSGKTTTLKTICEGRHINTIGTGNATSAVPIYVSYSKQRSFNIEWKSKELLKQIFTYLIEVFDDFKFQEFDLDNEETRKTWLKEIDELRISGSCPRDIKQIAICSLLLKYYKTKEFYKFVNNITISHIPSITKFPDKFEQRWIDSGSDNFKIEESLFIFVEQVDYYCPSTVLKDLNCTFIDCPGLFNNSYDTKITNKILANVNAIIYIIPYNKEFGENVSNSLDKIKNDYKDIHRKLFIAQNISLKQDNNFLDKNRTIIKNKFGEKEYITYDAHLAYIGQTLYSYKHNLLSEEDVCHFCKPVERTNPITGEKTKIEFKDFDEAFDYHIKSYLDIIESSEFPPKAEAIINTSNFKKLITELQEFINKNDAYSIIVGEGIDKLSSELTSLRTTLYSSHIEPYFASKEKIELLWENRLKKIESFQTTVSNIKNKILFGNENNREKLSTRLTTEIYQKLFNADFYNKMFDIISDTIYNERGVITAYIGVRGLKEQAFIDHITPLINKQINILISDKIELWHYLLKTGQDQDFVNIFTSRMKELEVALKDEWRELFYDQDNKHFQLHNYISLYSYVEDYYKNANINTDDHSYGHFGSTNSQIGVLSAVGGEILIVVTSIASMVTLAITIALAAGFTNPVGWCAILIGGATVAALIATKGKEWVRNKFKEYFKEDLRKIFDRENIYSKFKGIIEIQINSILKACNETISLNIEKMKMERDIATSLSEEDIEKKCIEAVDVINTINQQLKQYKYFKEKHVIYEKD